MTTRLAFVAVTLVGAAGTLRAQRVSVAASRWLTTPHVMDYRLSISQSRLGPVAFLPFGQVTIQGPRGGGAIFAGAGIDVTVRLVRRARPYLIGSLSGGFLDLEQTVGVGLWHAWSAGVGFEVFRTELGAAAIEVRHQALSRQATGGLSLGIRLGSPIGGRRSPLGDSSAPAAAAPPAPDPAPSPPRADRIPAERAAPGAALDAVAAARSAMGAPYRWGGTAANGFDCSGLIRYAYGTLGIVLPRRSVDQARHGRSVPLRLDALVPGDILGFSASPGGEVSHVGLYVGDGQFIHSASDGVRQSGLRVDDSAGRWWVDRWVAARRILE